MPDWPRHSHGLRRRRRRLRLRLPRHPLQRQPRLTPRKNGLLAGLDWLDSLSMTGLDGQNLNEIGLKNGNLIVDDQQRGNKWSFENISLSLRRPSGGGRGAEPGCRGR